MARKNVPGTVYLLHFDRKFHHAQHYIGWTEKSIAERLLTHQSGYGAKIVKAALAAGITICVVRAWKGTRELERRLKNQKKSRCLCPLCK